MKQLIKGVCFQLLSKGGQLNYYTRATLSWHVKKNTTNSFSFTGNCRGTCFNQLCAWRSFPYYRSIRKYTETEDTIHLNCVYTFRIFRILACPAALVSTWFYTEIHESVFLTPCRREIPHFVYCKFNSGMYMYNEVLTRLGPGIIIWVLKYSLFMQFFYYLDSYLCMIVLSGNRNCNSRYMYDSSCAVKTM